MSVTTLILMLYLGINLVAGLLLLRASYTENSKKTQR